MNRILTLGIPLVALFTGALRSGAPVKADPAALAVFWTASLSAETNRDFDDALKQVGSFEQGGGDKYLATLRAAWLEYCKANYPRAAEFYTAAARLQPAATAPLLGAVNAFLGAADLKKASAAAEAVLRIDTTNYGAMMVLSNISLGGQDFRRALAGYRRVLAVYPGDLDAISGASWSALYLGDKSSALNGFRLILSLNNSYAHAQKGHDLCAGATPKP